MIVWLTGQVLKYKEPKEDSAWAVMGIFDSEDKAVQACKDHFYFVAPFKLNEELPIELVENPGAYYPILPPDNYDQD